MIPHPMKHIKKPLFLFSFAVVLGARAFAANFDISTASTTAQTLSASQTGTIELNGSITLPSGNSTVAVTITGNGATLTNLGSIIQNGTGRVVRDNTGVTGLIINNGSVTNSTALMQAADADVIQMNKTPASVTLNNYGQMISLNASAGGSQAVDFAAILSGTNTINNFSTGLMKAIEADAVRPGVNGTVYNAGTILSITTTGSSSDGVDLQNNSGVQITNDTTGLVEGGRHGITGGPLDNTLTFTANITNNAGGVIKGDNGGGINFDGFNNKETITVINHGTITGNGHDISNGVSHDGDGIDVDGLVNVTNTGIIRSINAFNIAADGVAHSEGMTVGGGTITNSGTIEGLVASGNTNAVGIGISLLGNDSLTVPGTREAIYGNATVTNQSGGLIRGDSSSGIFVDGPASGFTITINNNAGATIRGGATLAGLGGTAPAILTGADNDTINNAGAIDGSSNGKAINLGAGNNTLNITGGSASILGDVDGGTGGSNSLVIDPGTGNTFSYAGTITHFATAQIKSGTFRLTGTMTAGGTTVNGGTLSGTGTVNGLVTVTTGGVISPGNSPGKLTLQTGVDFSSGGKYFWQLASLTDDGTGTAGTDFDQLLLNGGNLTLGGTSLLTLDFSLLGVSDPNSTATFWDSNHSWTIIDGNGATNTGSTNFSQITNATYADGFFTTSSDSAGNTVLNFQAVPEPGSASLLVVGALGLLARRRRA